MSDVTRKMPRLNNVTAPGRLFKRSSILGGDIKVLFGPGQSPEASIDVASYEPPSEWPSAGRLLRPVQNVWITCEFFDAREGDTYRMTRKGYFYTIFVTDQATPWPRELVDSGFADICGNEQYTVGHSVDLIHGELNTDGSGTVLYGTGETLEEAQDNATTVAFGTNSLRAEEDLDDWYDESIPNPHKALYDKFHGEIIQGVIDRLAEIRPERTWVQSPTWWGGGNGDISAWSLFLAPAHGDTNWFTADFLHIHIGVPVPVTTFQYIFHEQDIVLNDPNDADDANPNLYHDDGEDCDTLKPIPDGTAMAELESFTGSASNLVARAPRFSGYKVYVYGANFQYESLPAWREWATCDGLDAAPSQDIRLTDAAILAAWVAGPGSSTPCNDVPPPLDKVTFDGWRRKAGGNDSRLMFDLTVSDTFLDDMADRAFQNGKMASRIAGVGVRKTNRDNALNAFLAETCAAYPSVLEYKGEVDETWDADRIVGVIASHFGFDPETGKDLG